MNKKVAIIGYGWVGYAMARLFPKAIIYVHNDKNSIPGWLKDYQMTSDREIVNRCDIAFICVPTPNHAERGLDTTIVEEVIDWCNCPLLVVRSTVNPRDCDKWSIRFKKRIVMQPEYLGETPAHPMLDPKTRPFLILGGEKLYTRELIELYQTVYNANVTIRQTTAYEAAFIKLSENRAISIKVAEIQELYDVCENADLDFYTIREAVYGDDPRFNLWWTFVFPDKRGFNSKCIPKDVYAWCAFAESLGYNPKITKALLNKNKEWIKKY